MMIQKTNSKKNLKKSNGNVHISEKIKIKDKSEIKSLKRKLKNEPENNESKKKKINKNRNSAEESKKVFEESTTNLSPQKRRKAKLGASSVLKKDVNAGDSDKKQVKCVTRGQKEKPDKNENVNHHNVKIKKRVVCIACGDKGHKTSNCSLLEGMKVVECCSKCLSSDHYSDDCSKVHGKAKSGSCRNCKDPNHTFWTCEKECKFCPDNTDGHMRKDCTKAGHCHNCGKSGHYAYRCEEKCKYCNNNSDGHVRKDCQKPTLGKTCFNCNQNGHILKDCPDKEQE